MQLGKRNCPLCGKNTGNIILKLSPEGIVAKNTTYDLQMFCEALGGFREHLTYRLCDCGMIYSPVIWPENILQQVYELTIDHQQSEDKIYQIEKRLYLVRQWEQILRLLAIQGRTSLKGLRVIDFGCGWGDAVEVMRSPGVDVIGFEQDRLKISGGVSRGNRIIENFEELKKQEPADVFILNAVIEHVQDVDSVMRLASEKLKPKGILVLSTMDFRSGFIAKNKLLSDKNEPLLSQHFNPVEHVNIYDYFLVRKTLKKYGFGVFATQNVLQWANTPIPYLKNSRKWIRLLNKIEWLFARLSSGAELPITVFAGKVDL